MNESAVADFISKVKECERKKLFAVQRRLAMGGTLGHASALGLAVNAERIAARLMILLDVWEWIHGVIGPAEDNDDPEQPEWIISG